MNNDEFKLLIAGDLLPSGNNIKLFKAGNVGELFGEKVCKLFSDADYSIINLEGALTDSNLQQLKVDPILKAPIAAVNGIKALGVKAVALANNHITDYCDKGYVDTINVLEKCGIQHVGSGRNKDAIKKYLSLSFGDRKICIYNVSETFFNVPTIENVGCNLYDEWVTLNEIKELKRTHDCIVIIYHGGAELFPYPTPLVRKRFHRMADCGADFITAQHTHCIGCEEWYNGAYLLYGQGNFLFSRMGSPLTKQGLIAELTFKNSKKGFCIRHHRVQVSEQEIMQYDENQDLADFKYRSKELQNVELINTRYELYAYQNPWIKVRGLKACRGNSFEEKVLRRFFPNLYKKKCMEKYNIHQLLRMMIMHFGERYNEDFCACLRYMIGSKGIE